jgi:hypothetical protein
VFGSDTALGRDTVYQYVHQVRTNVDSLRAGPVHLNLDLYLRNDIQRTHRSLDSYGFTYEPQRGEQFSLGADIAASSSPTPADTIRLSGHARYSRKDFYNGVTWALSNERVDCAYTRLFGLSSPVRVALTAGVGYELQTVEDWAGDALLWRASAAAEAWGQRLVLYGRRDAVPYSPPFDHRFIVPARVPDILQTFGGALHLRYRKLALLAGYAYSTGADSATVAHAWPEGQYPYAEPHHVITVAPSLGRFYGLAVYGRWLLSDTKPYHRANGVVSYVVTTSGGSQHIGLDVAVDYWSPRERRSYGGIDIWHRTIFNLSGKAFVQIRSFRLFYKVDNILNRKYAYVPGYFMPGLTFRWGFNWYFQR